MKPDSAVIYFTVFSGTGYGIIISLISVFLYKDINIDFIIKIIISSLSLFFIISGLIASTIHLGHPLRAWRALSQWRSSWLSREGLVAITTFIPLIIFCFLWMFTDYRNLTFIFLIFSSFFCLLTVLV